MARDCVEFPSFESPPKMSSAEVMKASNGLGTQMLAHHSTQLLAHPDHQETRALIKNCIRSRVKNVVKVGSRDHSP